MKILTISNYYPEHPGGIEFVAKNLVDRWRRRQPVRWMACDLKYHSHHSAIDDVPISAINFAEIHLGFPYPIPLPGEIKKIFKEVKKSEIVHLHDCLYAVNLVAFLAAKMYHKPVVLTQHVGLIPYKEIYKIYLQKLAYAIMGRWVLENADQVIFISTRINQFFKDRFKFKKTTLLIPNGVDRKLFYPPKPNERELFRSELKCSNSVPNLVFVGRFTQKKGLNIVREIAKARPNWHWWIIGNGEVDPHNWNLENIEVIPSLPQIELRRYYLAANLFVLPSTGEGFPLAAQEALACGLPVALSTETAFNLIDTPVIELEISDIPGILKKLDDQLKNEEALLRMREAVASYAAQWDWEIVAAQYEDVFLSLTSK